MLVPRKAMAELLRLLGDAPAETGIEFGKDDNHLFFRIGSRLLICRMLTGQFPNYEAVLPKGCDRVALVEHDQLTAASAACRCFPTSGPTPSGCSWRRTK